MAVLGKRKAPEPWVSQEDAAAIFRRHFEAQFAPLTGTDPKRATAQVGDDESDSEEEDGEDEEADEDDEEGWGGFSESDEDSDEYVEEGLLTQSLHVMNHSLINYRSPGH